LFFTINRIFIDPRHHPTQIRAHSKTLGHRKKTPKLASTRLLVIFVQHKLQNSYYTKCKVPENVFNQTDSSAESHFCRRPSEVQLETALPQPLLPLFDSYAPCLFLKKYVNISIGNGNTIVEFLSAEIVFNVCKLSSVMVDSKWRV
jgi:hypothetical protein